MPRESTGSRITLGQACVALSIEEVRGIRNIPKMKWGGQSVEFEQGSGRAAFKSGLHAPVEVAGEGAHPSFSFDLGLDGIERQRFVPVARNNQVGLKLSWPHTQFGGRFLPSPKQRRVDQNGFGASRNISPLASNAQQQRRRRNGGHPQGRLAPDWPGRPRSLGGGLAAASAGPCPCDAWPGPALGGV